MPTVFLSSTASDLQAFRAAVRKAIQGLDGFSCIAMEDFGSVELVAETYCGKAVESADVLVGIVGLRHGSSPTGNEESFTELEYEAAAAHGIPGLMFVAPAISHAPAICANPTRNGKRAGLAGGVHRPQANPARRHGLASLARRPAPSLVVVDYAETGRDMVAGLVAAALAHGGGKLRLLLLARGGGDWWEAMKREGRGVGEVFAGPAASRVSLQPPAMGVEERRDSYRLAAASLAAALRVAPPEEEPDDYAAAHFERVLLLHMAALAAIDGVPVKDEDGILDYVLARERRFWEGLAASRGLARPLADGTGRAMAAITLGGGADDKPQALAVFKGLAFFDGQPRAVLEAVARLLHDSYPGRKWIEPVFPTCSASIWSKKGWATAKKSFSSWCSAPPPNKPQAKAGGGLGRTPCPDLARPPCRPQARPGCWPNCSQAASKAWPRRHPRGPGNP